MIIDVKRIAELCRAHDIGLLRVFGSVARGEEGPDSDLDLLVRFDKRKTLLDLIAIEDEFGLALGRKVDLVTEGALSPYIKDRVLREARVLYEHAA